VVVEVAEARLGQEVVVEQVVVELAQIAGLILLQALTVQVVVVVVVLITALIEMDQVAVAEL
jgi:hypothetical protein